MKTLLLTAALLVGAGARAQNANANYPNLLATFARLTHWKGEDSLKTTKPLVLITNGLVPAQADPCFKTKRTCQVFGDSASAAQQGFLPSEHSFIYLENVELHRRLRHATVYARLGNERVRVRLLNDYKADYPALWDVRSVKRYRDDKWVGYEWYLGSKDGPRDRDDSGVYAVEEVYWGPKAGK